MPPTRQTTARVYEKLAACYGHPQPTHPRGRPMDVLVETILSQHTSDKNSHRAYLSLRRALPRWETVADASLSDIEDAIRCGGLARQKARIIKNTLTEIRSREGRVSLQRLPHMDDEAIYAYLTSLPGIGSKTACCVMPTCC